MIFSKHIEGQSLFEVVVAIGLVAVVMTGILSLSTITVRNSGFSQNKVVATKYTQEVNEWIRSQRDTSWDTFVGNISDNSAMCVGDLSWGGSCDVGTSIFKRSASFNCSFDDGSSIISKDCDTSPTTEINLVDVEVVVSWEDSQGTHEVKSLSNLTRWR